MKKLFMKIKDAFRRLFGRKKESPAVEPAPRPVPVVSVDEKKVPEVAPEPEKRVETLPVKRVNLHPTYSSVQELLADRATIDYQHAVTLDGRILVGGFGPPIPYLTMPNGSVVCAL